MTTPIDLRDAGRERPAATGTASIDTGLGDVFLAISNYSELSQCGFRLFIWAVGAMVLTVLYFLLPYAPEVDGVYFPLMALILFTMTAGLALFLAAWWLSPTYVSPQVIALVGVLVDYAVFGYAMYLAPILMVPALALFPLIALTNGIRYGTSTLAYCLLLGFVVLYFVATAPWYREHWPLSVLAFLQIVALPFIVYVMMLALKRARDVAQRASKAKSAFLATMSHELRTPLTAIISGSDLAVLHESDEYLETIRTNAHALLDTVNDVLDLASVEHGSLPVEPRPFDFAVVIRQVQTGLEPRAKVKGLELTVDAQPPPGFVMGDARRVRQVLMNLLGNAIKFTDRGSVTLKIRYYEPVCSIEVNDTGPGIEDEHRARIWEPFYQASSGATRSHSGTGLGLTIVQSLVGRMNGSVRMETKVGIGTRFLVRVPLPRTEQGPPGLGGHDSATYLQDHRRRVRAKRILLVDDEELNRRYIQRLLERAGHIVHEAATPAQAEASLLRRSWDLVLMDQHMPGKTGLDVVNTVRATGKVMPPIVLLTGDATEELRREAIAFDVLGVVTKPVSLVELLDAVESHAQ